jgi:ribosomal protein L19E
VSNAAGRAKFARQLYNFRHMLEVEGEAEDTVKKVINLQEDIKRHVKQYSLKSFRTKGTQRVNISTMNKRRRSDEDLGDGSATGGAGGVNGAD